MKKSKDRRIRDYPPELRGLVINRHGGNKLQRERGLRGTSRSSQHGPVKVYSDDERKTHEAEMRERGKSNEPPR